jgi:hypothetical protein
VAHSSRAHARLSPSGAYRWVNCPGSVAMSAEYPNAPNPHSDEGTVAHEVAELAFKQNLPASSWIGCTFSPREGVRVICTEEMTDGVQMYLDYVRPIAEWADELLVEERLDLTHISDDQFGTLDFGAYNDLEQALVVVDFKFGRVPVSPNENLQLLSYASGAARRYHNRGLRKVKLVVVQPRAGGIKEWETTPEQLADAEKMLRLAAANTNLDGAPRHAGEWCRWCPAMAVCPEAREKALESAKLEFGEPDELGVSSVVGVGEVSSLTGEALAKAMRDVKYLEAYARQVKAHAMTEAREGRLPDWKIVASRPQRSWVSQDEARMVLSALFDLDEDEIAPRRLVSPAQAEKLIGGGKKTRDQITKLTEKTSKGVTLAPLSDPRPALAADAAMEFGEDDA